MRKSKSVGGVVVNKEGKILIVNQDSTSWSLPKGRAKKGEKMLAAAKREVYEESGLTELKFIKMLGSYQRYQMKDNGSDDKSVLKTITMFLFKTDQESLKPVVSDIPEARWVDKEKVADMLTHRKDKEFFLSILGQIL